MAANDIGGLSGLVLCQVLADAQDRDQPVGEGGLDLEVKGGVGLVRSTAGSPLGVADDHEGAQPGQHRGRHVAGERSLQLAVDILRAQAEASAADHFLHGRKSREGRA